MIRLVEELPRGKAADMIGKQLLRCGTSVGANFRASCRARSQADFIAKLGIVEEEADETVFWMELLVESEIIPQKKMENLLNEANQLVAIIVSSIKTAKNSRR